MVSEGSLVHVLVTNWPLVLAVVYLASLLTSRFNRGLNKYPGPFIASLTDWWRLWDVYKRRPERTHIELHRKHGDVVRLGPNTLSFADPKALKTIYGLNKGFTKVFILNHEVRCSGKRHLKWILRRLDADMPKV